MSQQNVELVRRAYAALNERDEATANEITAPDVEVRAIGRLPDVAVIHGRDDLNAWWQELVGARPRPLGSRPGRLVPDRQKHRPALPTEARHVPMFTLMPAFTLVIGRWWAVNRAKTLESAAVWRVAKVVDEERGLRGLEVALRPPESERSAPASALLASRTNRTQRASRSVRTRPALISSSSRFGSSPSPAPG